MATSNDRLRARYGICLSDSCQKCKDKTVQIITGRKDFVCEECGKPLREVPRPQTACTTTFLYRFLRSFTAK